MAYVTRPTLCALLFIHVTLICIIDKGARADVLNDCVNVPKCIGTYADIYDALASKENSFKIESALYPVTKPSSVRVFVSLYGQNGSSNTDNTTSGAIRYTWSLSCLYAAFPALLLEFLSLGSILVTNRTQKLEVKIPHFCCNVSVKDRREITENVLAALQDLAVNPGLRDGRLNSAECVTNEHVPDIEATGRHIHYLRAVLWCTIICDVLLTPVIFSIVLTYLEIYATDQENCELCSVGENCCCFKCGICKGEKPLIRSVTCFCYILFLLEAAAIFTFAWLAFKSKTNGKFPFDCYAILGGVGIEMLVLMIHYCKSSSNSRTAVSFYSRFPLMMCTYLVLYHLCWVAIGIMINPTWGLSVFLIAAFSLAALFLVIYQMSDVDECKSELFCERVLKFLVGFFGLCFAVAAPVIVGRSFYGRESADDILKTALLSVIGGLSWLYLKSSKPSTDTSQHIKAAEEAAAAAKALVEIIRTVPQADGTRVNYTIAAAATTGAAVAAAKAATDAAAAGEAVTAATAGAAVAAAKAATDPAAAGEVVTAAKVGAAVEAAKASSAAAAAASYAAVAAFNAVLVAGGGAETVDSNAELRGETDDPHSNKTETIL